MSIEEPPIGETVPGLEKLVVRVTGIEPDQLIQRLYWSDDAGDLVHDDIIWLRGKSDADPRGPTHRILLAAGDQVEMATTHFSDQSSDECFIDLLRRGPELVTQTLQEDGSPWAVEGIDRILERVVVRVERVVVSLQSGSDRLEAQPLASAAREAHLALGEELVAIRRWRTGAETVMVTELYRAGLLIWNYADEPDLPD